MTGIRSEVICPPCYDRPGNPDDELHLCAVHRQQLEADRRRDWFEPKRIPAKGAEAREKELVWGRIQKKLKAETREDE